LNPLALYDAAARDALEGVVGVWAALELVIRVRAAARGTRGT
jgi:hypothetical protein